MGLRFENHNEIMDLIFKSYDKLASFVHLKTSLVCFFF